MQQINWVTLYSQSFLLVAFPFRLWRQVLSPDSLKKWPVKPVTMHFNRRCTHLHSITVGPRSTEHATCRSFNRQYSLIRIRPSLFSTFKHKQNAITKRSTMKLQQTDRLAACSGSARKTSHDTSPVQRYRE